jgi:trimeric autotransporter adhesin
MHLGRTSKLQFAALTTLAVLLLSSLGAQRAAANDLSTNPCTAGDVEIVGSGVIINEPCACTPSGTFNAVVRFTVRNNTSTGRYCIALHLVPDGTVLTQAFDVVLRDANGTSLAPGKSGGDHFKDTVMFGTIPNFPCNLGLVCFGDAGVVRGKCSPGRCTTISWNTSPGNANCTTADETPPGGQCRHQQVCVVGFGATLACTANCTVACGQSATLRACVVGPVDRGPYTMTLTGSDGSSATQSTFGDASGTACVNFTVTPTQSPTTTYTLTVTDKNGCTRTATATVGVTPTTVTITPPANPGCNGILVYTASVSGQNTCGFTWTIDGLALGTFRTGGAADDARVARVSGTGANTLDFRALDNTCHTIQVSASCSNGNQTPCTGTASATAKQCVGPPTNNCSVN